MIILKNQTTGKSLKLKDKDAKEVFGIEGQKHAHLVCLPARMLIPTLGDKNIQIVHERKRTKKIGGTCVVRMGGIGDLIILSSSLAKMKKKEPNKPLTLATLGRYVQIMSGLKGVDLCISIDDMGKYSFDKTIDLRYAVEPSNIGPGSLSWRRYVSNDRSENFDLLCGVTSKKRYYNIPVSEKIKFPWIVKRRPLIGFCPTTKSPVRVVPPEYVEKIVQMLGTLGTVVLLGQTEAWNKNLLDIGGCVNLLNKTDEQKLIDCVAAMNLVIAPDTGILHIAGAMKKKSIGLFGPIDPDTRIKYYKNMTSIYPIGEMPCIPCHDIPGACDSNKPGAPCMRMITPERIFMAAKEMLR